MNSNVDLRELAINRGDTDELNINIRRHLMTRYVLPLVLLSGVVFLVAWSSRDLIFPPKPVTVVPVFSTTTQFRQEGTPLFNAAGWIEPRPTPVRVAALATGVVEELLVVEDQEVKLGEPIAKLVKDDAKLTYSRALADLELRLAELDESKATLVAAETRLKKPVHLEAPLGDAQASLAHIETELKNLPFKILRAEADYTALKKDYEGKKAAKGVVAGVNIDIAKSKSDSAKVLVEELQDQLNSLKKEKKALTHRRNSLKTQRELLADEIKARDEAVAKVRAAKARVEQARVVVAEAKLLQDRMTVRSPINGRVFRLIAHPGARIGSGMTQMEGHDGSTVVTLYRPKMLQIRVDVRFEDIPKVSLNQPVEINNPALSSPLTGKVLFISSEADIQKNTLQVKVDIPDPPIVFKPEMLVDVTFQAPKQSKVSTKPSQEIKLYLLQQLIHQDEENSFVWLADQSDGIASKTIIQTGAVGSNGLVEITSGLTVSSRIISSGTDQMQDGDRIQVTSEDSSLGTAGAYSEDDSSHNLNRPPTGDNK